MNSFKDNSPRELINRKSELELIEIAFAALIHKRTLLSTPIIDFFGIDGIGKTRILQEISYRCSKNDLPCIKLDENQKQLTESQNIARISRAILQQAKKYNRTSQKKLTARKGDPRTQTVEAIKVLLESMPVVILFDSIDTSNGALVDWLKITLRELIEHNNLFVVLTSKQRIVFENDWLMARKLTPFQLKPLNRADCGYYLDSLAGTIKSETREFIFKWTRGYPFAMEVMTKAIIQQHFDIEKSEDQKRLITIIIEEVIDKKVLALVEPSQLNWYKEHFMLLSIPRRFNLVIMQDLLEEFGTPSIKKTRSKLDYMALPNQLNHNTDVLHWDMQKAGFTVDESIRNIFLIYLQVYNSSMFIMINQYLAIKNRDLATEMTGPERVRYLREYLYHSAQGHDAQTVETILQPALQQISDTSSDAIVQFHEEFKQDEELQEILGKDRENVYKFIEEHLTHEE